MTLSTKAYLLLHILWWRLNWNRWNTRYPSPVPENPKFMTPRDAVRLIRDGDIIGLSGLGSTQWTSAVFRAIRESFQETQHPRDLTLVTIGGVGARGRAPGSSEELGLPGLCTRLFAGHTETFKSLLRLADAGRLEIQCLPQGVMAQLLDGQGRGEESLLTRTGVGTFVDPRVGRGTPIIEGRGPQWVEVEGDALRFRLPKVNVALFNAPAADREGNIYIRNAAMIAEMAEISRAARRNGGKVIANVGRLVEKNQADIFIRAEDVDAIVYHPRTEQVGSVQHRRHWPLFTTNSNLPMNEAMSRLKFANHILGFTPRRNEIDNSLARLAATTFAEHAHKGSLVNIGVGLPEEVCRLIVKGGLYDDITLFTESGVMGGLPAPGVFFGSAVCPKTMMPSVDIFRLCSEKLDVSILGVLEADSEGNVNVSKRGEGAINYVGPGGFMDFSTAAKTVIFVCSWMLHGKFAVEGETLRLIQPGKPKFVDRVSEVTFNARAAGSNGKTILYVTNVGVFRLTPGGMELARVMPGIDIQRDIMEQCSMKIVLPASGNVPVVDGSVVSGRDFRLALKG